MTSAHATVVVKLLSLAITLHYSHCQVTTPSKTNQSSDQSINQSIYNSRVREIQATMEPINNFPVTNTEILDHQAIRTQIDADVDWDQFWREYNTLNPDYTSIPHVRRVHSMVQGYDMGQVMEYQEAAGVYRLSPSPVGQFDLPQFGSDLIFPDYIDPSLTPPSTDPSTSNSSPSATSSSASISASSTSTPSDAPSSASEGSFTCNFCAQTFAQRCLLK